MKIVAYIVTRHDEMDWLEPPFASYLNGFVKNLKPLCGQEDLWLVTDNDAVKAHFDSDFSHMEVIKANIKSEGVGEHVAKTVRRLGYDDDETVLIVNHHYLGLGGEYYKELIKKHQGSGKLFMSTNYIRGLAHQFICFKKIRSIRTVLFLDEALAGNPRIAVTKPFVYHWSRYDSSMKPGRYRLNATREGVRFEPCSSNKFGETAYDYASPNMAKAVFPANKLRKCDGVSLPVSGVPEMTLHREADGVRLRFDDATISSLHSLEILPFSSDGPFSKGAYMARGGENSVLIPNNSMPADASGVIVVITEPVYDGVPDSVSHFKPKEMLWTMDKSGQVLRKNGAVISGRQATPQFMEGVGDSLVGTVAQLTNVRAVIENGEACAYPLPEEIIPVHTRFDFLSYQAMQRAVKARHHV